MSSYIHNVRIKYSIPDEYIITEPILGEHISSIPSTQLGPNSITVAVQHLNCGMRFPILQFIRDVLHCVKLPLSAVAPQGISIIVGYMRFCEEEDLVPSLSNFFAVCSCKKVGDEVDRYYFTGKVKFMTKFRQTLGKWYENFIWVTPPSWDNWGFPTLFYHVPGVGKPIGVVTLPKFEKTELQARIGAKNYIVEDVISHPVLQQGTRRLHNAPSQFWYANPRGNRWETRHSQGSGGGPLIVSNPQQSDPEPTPSSSKCQENAYSIPNAPDRRDAELQDLRLRLVNTDAKVATLQADVEVLKESVQKAKMDYDHLDTKLASAVEQGKIWKDSLDAKMSEVELLGGQIAEAVACEEELNGQIKVLRQENEMLKLNKVNSNDNGHLALETNLMQNRICNLERQVADLQKQFGASKPSSSR